MKCRRFSWLPIASCVQQDFSVKPLRHVALFQGDWNIYGLGIHPVTVYDDSGHIKGSKFTYIIHIIPLALGEGSTQMRNRT